MNILTDKEIISDSLTTQKHLTDMYNTYANECANECLREDFLSLLEEEHDIQYDIFKEMNKRGWYPLEQAPQEKINSAKQQITSS